MYLEPIIKSHQNCFRPSLRFLYPFVSYPDNIIKVERITLSKSMAHIMFIHQSFFHLLHRSTTPLSARLPCQPKWPGSLVLLHFRTVLPSNHSQQVIHPFIQTLSYQPDKNLVYFWSWFIPTSQFYFPEVTIRRNTQNTKNWLKLWETENQILTVCIYKVAPPSNLTLLKVCSLNVYRSSG